MKEPFVGSEALRCGSLSRHQLRMRYRAVLPDVYLSNDAVPSLDLRIAAAWLWSGCQAVIAGAAAAFLHGAKWIPDNVPIEVICDRPRAPRGVLTRRCALTEGETQSIDGLPSPHPSEPPSISGGAGPSARPWFGSTPSRVRRASRSTTC